MKMLLFLALRMLMSLSSWVKVFFLSLSSYIWERLSSIFLTSATFKFTIVYISAFRIWLFGLRNNAKNTWVYPKETLSWWEAMRTNGWVGTLTETLNCSCSSQTIGSIRMGFAGITPPKVGRYRLYSFKKLLNSYFLFINLLQIYFRSLILTFFSYFLSFSFQ